MKTGAAKLRIGLKLALIIGLPCLLAAAAIFWLKSQMTRTDYTVDQAVQQVIIGNDVLNIPSNFIRSSRQRSAVTLEQIDLALLWPQGAGYSQDMRGEFERSGPDSKLVFISLRKRAMPFDMTDRLDPIYSTLFEGSATKGPDGMLIQPLQKGKGYDGEVLAVAKSGGSVWVARCQTEDSTTVPTCLRDLHMGESLSVVYRFPRKLLSQWSDMETMVQSRIEQFIVR